MPAYARYKHAQSTYEILDTLEAGIVLAGPEVKSTKNGQIDLRGSYVTLEDNALVLRNAYIAPYLPAKGIQSGYDPNQDRRLLISKKERDSLTGKLKTKGLTMIPLSVYSKSGLVKVEVALVRGKSHKDKRDQLKKKAVNLDIQRELRGKPR